MPPYLDSSFNWKSSLTKLLGGERFVVEIWPLGISCGLRVYLSRKEVTLLKSMVGARRFELPTSWSRTRRANQSALRPDQFSHAIYSIMNVLFVEYPGTDHKDVGSRLGRHLNGIQVDAAVHLQLDISFCCVN